MKAFPDEAPKTRFVILCYNPGFMTKTCSDVTQRIEALATDGTVEQAKSAIQMLLVGGFDAEVERVFDVRYFLEVKSHNAYQSRNVSSSRIWTKLD